MLTDPRLLYWLVSLAVFIVLTALLSTPVTTIMAVTSWLLGSVITAMAWRVK